MVGKLTGILKLDLIKFVYKLQESVITTIVKLSLKSLQEFVRLQTFNRSGFQQIQLDIQFLRTPLKEIVEDEAAIDFLLDEVIGKNCCAILILDSLQEAPFSFIYGNSYYTHFHSMKMRGWKKNKRFWSMDLICCCAGNCCSCWTLSWPNSFGASHFGQTYTSKIGKNKRAKYNVSVNIGNSNKWRWSRIISWWVNIFFSLYCFQLPEWLVTMSRVFLKEWSILESVHWHPRDIPISGPVIW